MSTLQHAEQAFRAIGLNQPERHGDTLRHTTHLFDVEALATPSGALRLQLRLIPGIVRNKIALWNIIHHNNHYFPHGQFYITPDNAICFGTLLPPEPHPALSLERMLYEMLVAVEGYFKLIQSDFTPLPFDEQELRPSVVNLFRSELTAPTLPEAPAKASAAPTLERVLSNLLGEGNVFPTQENEYSLVGDNMTTLTLMDVPQMRRSRHLPTWFLGVRTEIGVLDNTDDKLWVQFNRLNYESHRLSYFVKYSNRKPLVGINTEVAADLLQHPDLLQQTLDQHQQAALHLLERLSMPYRIQSVIQYNLGI